MRIIKLALLKIKCCEANKKELVADLIVKAKQVEYLIKSLPEPEPEENQVCPVHLDSHSSNDRVGQKA